MISKYDWNQRGLYTSARRLSCRVLRADSHRRDPLYMCTVVVSYSRYSIYTSQLWALADVNSGDEWVSQWYKTELMGERSKPVQ